MKYQLVLQWPASSIDDYDMMISIEDGLYERLRTLGVVDGHDAGSSQVNIFIRTDDPAKAFECARSILIERDAWLDVRAAYRLMEGQEYFPLWPPGLSRFDVL